MNLKPDPASAHIDPFFAQTTLALFCDVADPHHRPALRARPALDRQEGRGLHGLSRHRRQGLLRPRGRVLHLRRRALHGRSLQHRLPRRLRRSCRTNSGTEYEMGNLGHRPRTKGGYFPVPPGRQLPGHPLRDAVGHGRDGRGDREAPPRGRRRPARARHEVRHARAHGRQSADLQVRDPQRRPGLRQDRDVHAQARLRRQRLGHARAPVDLEGRHAGLRRQQVLGPFRHVPSSTSAASSSTRRRSTPSPTR